MDSSKYAPANANAKKLSPAAQKEANIVASKLAAQRIMENVSFDGDGIARYTPVPKSTPANPAPPIMEPEPAHDTMSAMMAAAGETALNYNESQFAQTVDPDDLFADDFEPLPEPTVEEPVVPTSPKVEPPPPAQSARPPRQPRPERPRKQPANGPGAAKTSETVSANAQPTEPARSSRSAAAVRGDRSLTGAKARTKLTEKELSAKIEAMKLKNTKLEEDHAKAAADEASFQAEEQAARERARKERQERQQMMGEREKNAARKLKAMQSRDWDKEKREQEEGRGVFRRGAHGGLAGSLASRSTPSSGLEGWLDEQAAHAPLGESADDFMVAAQNGRYAGPGRGRGRGRGRGLKAQASMPAIRTQKVPNAADFPALPAAPPAARPSWADIMDE